MLTTPLSRAINQSPDQARRSSVQGNSTTGRFLQNPTQSTNFQLPQNSLLSLLRLLISLLGQRPNNPGNNANRGTNGDDVLNGTRENDSISGRGGNDRIHGRDGNDRLSGNSGNDHLSGDAGHDYLSGGSGNDTILGGTGNDTMLAGRGQDSLNGGTGSDTARISGRIRDYTISYRPEFVEEPPNDGLFLQGRPTILHPAQFELLHKNNGDRMTISNTETFAFRDISLTEQQLRARVSPAPKPLQTTPAQQEKLLALFGFSSGADAGVAVLDNDGNGRISRGDTAILSGGITGAEISRKTLTAVDVRKINQPGNTELNLSPTQLENIVNLFGSFGAANSAKVFDQNGDNRLSPGDLAVLFGGFSGGEVSRHVLTRDDITKINNIPNTGDLQQSLNSARRQWNNSGIDSYSFVLKRTCFCTPDSVRPVRITVIRDQITDARFADTGEVLPDSVSFNKLKIDDLFGVIQDQINNNAHSLQVTYNPGLGFPTSINADPIQFAADDEFSLTMSEFRPLRGTLPPATGNQEPPLDGTSWVLQRVNGQPPFGNSNPRLSFDNDQISYSDGVNSVFGGYQSATDGSFDTGNLASTRRGASPQAMAHANMINNAFSLVDRYDISANGNVLSFLDANGDRVLVYRVADGRGRS